MLYRIPKSEIELNNLPIPQQTRLSAGEIRESRGSAAGRSSHGAVAMTGADYPATPEPRSERASVLSNSTNQPHSSSVGLCQRPSWHSGHGSFDDHQSSLLLAQRNSQGELGHAGTAHRSATPGPARGSIHSGLSPRASTLSAASQVCGM